MAYAKGRPGKGKRARPAGRKAGPSRGRPTRGKGARRRKGLGPARQRDGKPGAAPARAKAASYYNAMFAAVDVRPPPWTPKNRRGGRSNIDPRALAKCVIVMNEENRPCRDMASYLHSHARLLRRLGLEYAPSKSTLNRATLRVPQRYLRRVGSAAPGPSRSRAAA